MANSSPEVEVLVRAKADEDEAFRALLLEDPRKAIEQATGLAMPEDLTVHVHEESATDVHLVLPPAGGALSDEEMRAAAGGSWSALW